MADPATFLAAAGRPLGYAYLGDLHLTDAQALTYRDLLVILAQLTVEGAGQPDFVYLPCDVADNDHSAQYRLLPAALKLPDVLTYLQPACTPR